jgi:chemotaxis protein MotB
VARKKKHEEHENHERWLVSYADFITLLFAFFVVMYSISSVNEGKYRVLSDSMVAAFRSPARSLQPVQVGQPLRAPYNPVRSFLEAPVPVVFTPIIVDSSIGNDSDNERIDIEHNGWAQDAAAEQVEEIADDVEDAMRPLIEAELVAVRRNRLWLEVELNTSYLFDSGSAQPSIDAEAILSLLANVLKDKPNRLHVEGFTDNRPIKSALFPSNWELASARAAAVVRLFVDYGLQPERLASIGYGEFRPVASNDTELGRMKNRRVVVVVLANLDGDDEAASVTDFELLRQKLQSTPSLVN